MVQCLAALNVHGAVLGSLHVSFCSGKCALPGLKCAGVHRLCSHLACSHLGVEPSFVRLSWRGTIFCAAILHVAVLAWNHLACGHLGGEPPCVQPSWCGATLCVAILVGSHLVCSRYAPMVCLVHLPPPPDLCTATMQLLLTLFKWLASKQ